MIPVTTIISRIEAALDTKGFQHYQFDEDYKPAINYAQDWLTQLYSRLMAEKKFSEESLRELTYVKVWKTTINGRINFDTSTIGGEIWTILGVYPRPEVSGTENPPVVPAGWSYITDYLYIKSEYSAKKTTAEKVNENRKNPYMKGNEVVTGELTSYSYLTFANYNGLISEIEIQPNINTAIYAGVSYVLQPTEITATTDSVKFPKSVLPLIVDKALAFISWKQGDKTSLYSVTEADMQKIIQLTA